MQPTAIVRHPPSPAHRRGLGGPLRRRAAERRPGRLAAGAGEIERATGLTISVGLAPNKFLAKIASDLDKPRGFAVIGSAEAQAFLAPRPVSILPGVGPALAKSLEAAGFSTVGDLARASEKALAQRFGANGLRLHRLAHGQDARAVNPESERKGVSAETTFDADLRDLQALEDRLWPCCERWPPAPAPTASPAAPWS